MVVRILFVIKPPVCTQIRLARRSRHDDRDSTSAHSLTNWYKAGAVGSTVEWRSEGTFSHCGSNASMAWTVVSRAHKF